MKKYILILPFLLIYSCTIKGNFKGLYSYYSITKKENPNLFINSNNINVICNKDFKNDNNVIYITNGLTLKECLNSNEKSIVYIWGAKCKSKICYPLEVIQNYCNKNNFKLYIVSEYYDSEGMSRNHDIETNILAVDTKHYNTDLTKKYLNLFFNDVDKNIDYNNLENKYLYFEKDVFIKSAESIYQIK